MATLNILQELDEHRTWMTVSRTLLDAPGTFLTATEVAERAGKDRSNIKKAADAMLEAGIVERAAPKVREARQGRPPGSAYRLVPAHVETVRTAVERTRAVGTLRAGQQVVFASASPATLPRLMEVMADPQALTDVVWAALLDGSPQEYALIIDGDSPVARATELVTLLVTDGIDCRRASVADRLSPAQISGLGARAVQARR